MLERWEAGESRGSRWVLRAAEGRFPWLTHLAGQEWGELK